MMQSQVPHNSREKQNKKTQIHRGTNELIRQVGKEMKMHKREEGQQDTGEEHKKGTYKKQLFLAFECNDTLNSDIFHAYAKKQQCLSKRGNAVVLHLRLVYTHFAHKGPKCTFRSVHFN